MTKSTKKKLSKVTLVKLASTSGIGKLPTQKIVPNKKKDASKYDMKADQS